LVAVGAITADFEVAVLDEKGDRDSIRAKLEDKGTEEHKLLAAKAETGMRIIRRDSVPLDPPDAKALKATYERLREVHAKAYDWDPPEILPTERSTTRRMRSYVRRWINEWDLNRLYPGIAISTEEQELRPSYEEDKEIETPIETSEEQ
jgi:hypothetical protein